MDRSWMNASRNSDEYDNGIEQFLEFARQNRPEPDERYFCPCVKCMNGRRHEADIIREHLICEGINTNYKIWIWHGELLDIPTEETHVDIDGDQFEDMIRDVGEESFQRAHVYDALKSDSETPLCPGCKNFTRLSAVLKLVNVKAKNGLAYRFYSSGLCKYLSKLNVGTVDDDLYGYFDPQSIQNMGNKGEEASGYIASRMSDAKKQIYLGAYHHDEHWQLLVIIPAKDEVVWFCSLHRKPDNRIKAVIQNAVTAYKVMGVCIQVDANRLLGYIPNNKQSGGWECGYYVMHCMLTIVRARITDGWMEMFDDVAALPTDGIREIRTEWAKQFLEVRSRLYA
ncbi:hypothetical protein OROHE_017683 [Orobanche hederae]